MKFKINFTLQDIDKILPFGEENDYIMHWFALTDGLLWIDVGDSVIYEYSKICQSYFVDYKQYNDYHLARFAEDFFDIFENISKSIPLPIYENIEKFDRSFKILWKDDYSKDVRYYMKFARWYYDRTITSDHLVGGPMIRFFRHGDKIKILWQSDYKLNNGESIWAYPNGLEEIDYAEFVQSVKDFLNEFILQMNEQVTKAVAKDWGNISLDKDLLIKEHAARTESLRRQADLLTEEDCLDNWTITKRLLEIIE